MEDKVFDYKSKENIELLKKGDKKSFEYNNSFMDRNQRISYLKNWFGKVGDNSLLKPNITLDFGHNIYLGDNTIINSNVTILDREVVYFGNNVLVGPNCAFYTSIHPLDINTRNDNMMIAKPIFVEDNVWIGGNVIVYPGVKINSGCVISAGSVVISDCIENGLYSGNPAKLIKVINQNEIDVKFKIALEKEAK